MGNRPGGAVGHVLVAGRDHIVVGPPGGVGPEVARGLVRDGGLARHARVGVGGHVLDLAVAVHAGGGDGVGRVGVGTPDGVEGQVRRRGHEIGDVRGRSVVVGVLGPREDVVGPVPGGHQGPGGTLPVLAGLEGGVVCPGGNALGRLLGGKALVGIGGRAECPAHQGVAGTADRVVGGQGDGLLGLDGLVVGGVVSGGRGGPGGTVRTAGLPGGGGVLGPAQDQAEGVPVGLVDQDQTEGCRRVAPDGASSRGQAADAVLVQDARGVRVADVVVARDGHVVGGDEDLLVGQVALTLGVGMLVGDALIGVAVARGIGDDGV